jgi:hypothetical protein
MEERDNHIRYRQDGISCRDQQLSGRLYESEVEVAEASGSILTTSSFARSAIGASGIPLRRYPEIPGDARPTIQF